MHVCMCIYIYMIVVHVSYSCWLEYHHHVVHEALTQRGVKSCGFSLEDRVPLYDICVIFSLYMITFSCGFHNCILYIMSYTTQGST
jgi:hypothetical protein